MTSWYSTVRLVLVCLSLGWLCCLLLQWPGVSERGLARASQMPNPPKFVPKFEALAETRLLMEGLAQANYRSVNKLLAKEPPDVETWIFIRGQALLLAETGNLLLLRPPRNDGRDTWMKLAMEMRSAAGALARQTGSRDYAGARAALVGLTTACNRCHQTFRVAVRLTGEPNEKQ